MSVLLCMFLYIQKNDNLKPLIRNSHGNYRFEIKLLAVKCN